MTRKCIHLVIALSGLIQTNQITYYNIVSRPTQDSQMIDRDGVDFTTHWQALSDGYLSDGRQRSAPLRKKHPPIYRHLGQMAASAENSNQVTG